MTTYCGSVTIGQADIHLDGHADLTIETEPHGDGVLRSWRGKVQLPNAPARMPMGRLVVTLPDGRIGRAYAMSWSMNTRRADHDGQGWATYEPGTVIIHIVGQGPAPFGDQ